MIQLACVAAVQLQPVLNEKDPFPPVFGKAALPGLIVYVQFPGPWLIANVAFPIVMDPVRVLVVGLAAADQEIDPSPIPDVAEVMLIHVVAVEAVHEQFVPKLTVPVSPDPLAMTLAGFRLKVQVAADWLTVKVCPATVKVPVREAGDVFTLTV